MEYWNTLTGFISLDGDKDFKKWLNDYVFDKEYKMAQQEAEFEQERIKAEVLKMQEERIKMRKQNG